MSRRLLTQLVICAALLATVVYWFNSSSSDTDAVQAAHTPQSLLIVPAEKLVKQEEFRKERTFTGLVRARRQSDLSLK
ncbi:MAG: hypothetical protein R3C11_23690 [Planctomycetaceae bacterium]